LKVRHYASCVPFVQKNGERLMAIMCRSPLWHWGCPSSPWWE